ncbi:unnamed protein product [Nippostrongylus brasiliensis]|uniref:Uncharacterized protein n=1 Tax=Nippostrongylus brasiliensis TaxID=27835 RepID=A0A0N4Y2Y9_NIPBR|nr:unnamed protein product [Nippostrongylus brasiliensis]
MAEFPHAGCNWRPSGLEPANDIILDFKPARNQQKSRRVAVEVRVHDNDDWINNVFAPTPTPLECCQTVPLLLD